MNILLQSTILPPYRLELFKELTRKSCEPITFAYGQALAYSALKSIPNPQNIQSHPLKNIYVGNRPFLTYQMGMLPLIRSGKYQTIIAAFDPRIVTNLAGFCIARKMGIKWIWWGHGIRPRNKYQNVYASLAYKADALILYSESGAVKLANIGIPKEKLFVAWNSIDIDIILKLVEPITFKKRHRILFIGRLIQSKKADLLIRAFAIAQSQLTANTCLTIIGDGPENIRLKKLANHLNLNKHMDFCGELYNHIQLSHYFNHAWLSVSPGSMGLSAIHSLAYGVPVLLAENELHGPEVEILHNGDNCKWFNSNDAHALAEQLIIMDKDRNDCMMRGRIGSEVIKHQFGIEKMIMVFNDAIQYVNNTTVVTNK